MTTELPKTASRGGWGYRLSRREFLVRIAAAGLVAGALARCGAARQDGWRMAELDEMGARLTTAEWETIAAAQDRLLPSAPDSPGARDVNAIGYLDGAMLFLIGSEARDLVRRGSVRLNELAEGRGVTRFSALAEATQAELLHELHDETDGDWTAVVLRHTLEALLGDPVYGVNTGQVGWTWLGIVGRYPRPPRAEQGRGG